MVDVRIGTRELRADLAAHVRRAASGHRVIVTIGGRSAATLGPITSSEPTIDALVASGQLLAPRRTGLRGEVPSVPVWSGVRLNGAFREVRG